MRAVFHYTVHRGNKPASVGTTLTTTQHNEANRCRPIWPLCPSNKKTN